MFLMRTKKVLVVLCLVFIAGCSSKGGMSDLFPPAGDNAIMIESAPSGAVVYVMGEEVGVTPLQIKRDDVFPNVYPKEKFSVYGRVMLKKEGCADFTRTVSTEISSKGLHAKLDCKNTNPALPNTAGEAPHAGETVEQRLEKIKDLLSKGLITEEEARKTRERILNEL